MFCEFYADVWNFFKSNWAKIQGDPLSHWKIRERMKKKPTTTKLFVCGMSVAWHLKFFTNWQEFTIVSFNHFDIKCIAVKCWQIFIYEKPKRIYLRKRRKKKTTDFNKFMKHCLWRRENCFFFSLLLSTAWNMINTFGLVESEYWVHIIRFIATFWQPAQRNKANIMTAIKDKYCADHVYFITTLISHPFTEKCKL